MKTHVLFVQGGGDGAYDADAKLVASLREALGPDYHVNYPRMPDENDLEYDAWRRRIAEELTRAGEAVLVGHSIGASVIAKVLAESTPRPALAGVFLIATPFWHDHEVWKWEEAELPRDVGARLPAGVPIFLYHGRDDETVPLRHVDMYATAIPQAVVRRLPGRNHQLNDDLSEVARDIKQLR
jgi:predicted alpha/beta hydrolase family esterase